MCFIYLIFTGTCLVCFEYVDHPHGKVADKEKGDDLSAWLVTNMGWRGGKPKLSSRMKRIVTRRQRRTLPMGGVYNERCLQNCLYKDSD